MLKGYLAGFIAGLRGRLAGLRADLRGCLVIVLNYCLELFKGLLELFLASFISC